MKGPAHLVVARWLWMVSLAAMFSVWISYEQLIVNQMDHWGPTKDSDLHPKHRDLFHLPPNATSATVRTPRASCRETKSAPFYWQLEDSTVLVTLAFGNVSKTKLVDRWLWSVRTNGRWTGRVAVLTDQPEHYQERFFGGSSGVLDEGQRDNPLIILSAKPDDLEPTTATWQALAHPIAYKKTPPQDRPAPKVLPFERDQMRYKRFKTLVLDYLDDYYHEHPAKRKGAAGAPYRLALYMDVDTVVARPLVSLLQDFQDKMMQNGVFASPTSDEPEADDSDSDVVDGEPDQEKKKKRKSNTNTNHNKDGGNGTPGEDEEDERSLDFLSMFSDCPTCARKNTNSGVILMHHRRSRECLREWNLMFLEDSSWGVYDQRYLRDLRTARHKEKHGGGLICKIHVLPDHHRLYPSRKDMRRKLSATVIHNTNSYNARKIPEHVQAEYFRWLLLPEKDRKSDSDPPSGATFATVEFF